MHSIEVRDYLCPRSHTRRSWAVRRIDTTLVQTSDDNRASHMSAITTRMHDTLYIKWHGGVINEGRYGSPHGHQLSFGLSENEARYSVGHNAASHILEHYPHITSNSWERLKSPQSHCHIFDVQVWGCCHGLAVLDRHGVSEPTLTKALSIRLPL